MCEVCHRTPCHPRCPNAPEPPVFEECAYCKEPIYAGEDYYKYAGEYYHEDCIREAALDILIREGAYEGTAQVEECDMYDDIY